MANGGDTLALHTNQAAQVEIYDELLSLIDQFDKDGVPFTICGGLAVTIHGFVRATEDIDMLVPAHNISEAIRSAGQAGFVLSSGRIPFAAGTPNERLVHRVSKVDGSDLLTLDLMEVTPALAVAWETRQEVTWENRRIWLVSKKGLAIMKRMAGRPKDLLDLQALGIEDEE